ncbi:MAG: signal peptidase I [Armatimonadetes bacterium]|nr:signal peptidase I [Armatimonadota bacterium]NOG94029.1 signal peptidase I [Armatimonadota bacterium]
MQIDLSKLGDPGEGPRPIRQGCLQSLGKQGFRLALIFVFLFLVFYFLNFQTVIVQGVSMEPTFRSGQRVLVCKALWLVGPPRDGDVIVLKPQSEGEYLIKRVYRVEGEEVDAAMQPEEWNYIVDGPYRVPPGHIYVIGDNYENSEDSRHFGPKPVTEILGKVIE